MDTFILLNPHLCTKLYELLEWGRAVLYQGTNGGGQVTQALRRVPGLTVLGVQDLPGGTQTHKLDQCHDVRQTNII